MDEEKVCDGCGMAYDWEGVTEDGTAYCCEPCARGQDCWCPEHHHQVEELQPWPTAAGL